MTIFDNGTRNQYTATAGQTVFTYTFEVFDDDDLAVEKNSTLLSKGTDYTISGVGNDNGGSITLLSPASAGDTLTLYRDMSLERLTDYQQNGDFLAEEVNTDYDRLWAALQQTTGNSSLGIRPSVSDTALNSGNTILADIATRAGKVLGFDAAGLLSYFSVALPVGAFKVTTVSQMINDSQPQAGNIYLTIDEPKSIYECVSSASGTNEYNSRLSPSDPSLAFARIDEGSKQLEQYGAGIGLNFMQQLNANRRDVFLLVQSDSTGDATNEWVYQVSDKLGDLFTQYTVEYYLWDEVANDYASPVTLSTGTGSNTLYVYNGAKAGSTNVYFTGNRKPNVYASRQFDLIIQNYGHNQTSAGSLNKAMYRLTESVSQLISDQPQAEIALTLQNIDTSLEDFSALQVEATKKIADLFGLGLIDVRSVFRWKQEQGTLSEWMNDVVHPNSEGSLVWRDIVINSLLNPNKQKVRMYDSLLDSRESLSANAFFDNWPYTESEPAGWTAGNATVSKETTIKETLSWSVKCEGTLGTTGSFSVDLSGLLSTRKAGAGLLFAARVYVPETNVNNDAGRVSITTDLGTEASSQYAEIFDGWSWRVVYLESDLIDGAATLSGSVFTGISGDECYVDRVFVGYARTPHEPRFIAETKAEYYDPDNVGAKGTNDITVVANAVTINSTSESFPAWHINVFGLVAGEEYTMTWTSSEPSGTVLAREGINDSGTVLETASPLSVNTISWRPTTNSGSLQVSSSLGNEPFTLSNITITKN